MKFNPKALLMTSAITLAFGGMATAAVSPQEAAKLGASLTPVGAEKSGNASGTIPAWTGGLASTSDRYANPYADEKPLFTITAQNAEQYKQHLTPGQLAMLAKYPDSFKMPVYPSHRSAAMPQSIYDSIAKNATSAQLTDEGNGISGMAEAIPFPIPSNGLEVIWNHMTRYRGGALERTFVQVPVQANGAFTAVKINEKMSWPSYLSDGYDAKTDQYVNMLEAGIIDPKKVTRVALENAASVSGMILTTECALIDIKEDAPAGPPMGGGMPGMM